MMRDHTQEAYDVRCEWGLTGAEVVGAHADIVVVIDVLSFTTAVSVAADLGIDIFPYRFRDESAREFAAAHDAVLAVGRSQSAPHKVTLSPPSIRSAGPMKRLVLPSPNGSTIVHALAKTDRVVVAASLRNADAVGRWITAHAPAHSSVAIIPSGERWPDDHLRPAVEDLWGAGAVIEALAGDGTRKLSPEAYAARAAWSAVSGAIDSALHNCSSGRELITIGFATDVEVASEINESTAVPVLTPTGYFENTNTAAVSRPQTPEHS